jgi:hypothetical protein
MGHEENGDAWNAEIDQDRFAAIILKTAVTVQPGGGGAG